MEEVWREEERVGEEAERGGDEGREKGRRTKGELRKVQREKGKDGGGGKSSDGLGRDESCKMSLFRAKAKTDKVTFQVSDYLSDLGEFRMNGCVTVHHWCYTFEMC